MRAVDLFAGAGGFTTGARDAGIEVVAAMNHWQLAVDAHENAHPATQHACKDLTDAMDWSALPDFDLLLASPECKGHTKARGKERKHHDASRATAWAVIDCCEVTRPRLAVVENVVEMMSTWTLYPAWRMAMETLGYTLTPHVIDSADAGVPQHRERMFLVCSLEGETRLQMPTRDHVTVRSVLDLDNLGGPVYKPGRAAATISRHEHGKANVGGKFLAPFYGRGSGKTGRSLDRPCGTLTTKARWSLHDSEHDTMRMLTAAETLAIGGFPTDYFDGLNVTWTDVNTMVGNAVSPGTATHILSQLK